MLLEQPITTEQNCKNKTSRLDELVQQYEDPVKALVHKLLEEYVEQSFQEFMGNRIGQIIERESDGKAIKDYRNGYRQVNQAVVDSLVMNNSSIGLLVLLRVQCSLGYSMKRSVSSMFYATEGQLPFAVSSSSVF